MSRMAPVDGRAIDAITEALTDADGLSVVVHLVGPRGSGRTFALDHVARWARHCGWTCIHVGGSGRPDPFDLTTQLLAALHSTHPAPTASASVGADLVDALRDLATRSQVLVVVDDVDLVDPDSIDVLSFVVRNLVDEHVAIVSSATGAAPWPSPVVVTIRLDPLAAHEIAALLVDQGVAESVAHRCAELSGGNPGMATAVAAGLTESQRRGQSPLPTTPQPVGTLAEEIRARLGSFGDRISRALVVAAADRRGDISVVRCALSHLGEDATGIEEAEAVGLVDLIDGRILFRDPWTAIVAPSLVAPASRRAAHRSLAHAHDRPEQAAERAWHLAAAADGPDERAAIALGLVANDQARQGALRAAAETARRAADLAERIETRAERLLDALAWSLDAGDVDTIRRITARLDAEPVSNLSPAILSASAEAETYLTGATSARERVSTEAPMIPADRQVMSPIIPWEARRARRRSVESALEAGDHRLLLEIIESAEYDPLGEGLSTVAALRHRGEIRQSRSLLLSTTSGAPFADPDHVLAHDDAFANWFALLCAVDLAVLVGRGDDADRLLSANLDRCPARLRDWARVLGARATLQQDPSLDPMSVSDALIPLGGGALLEIRHLIESGLRGRDLARLDEAIALATRERLPVEAAEARVWALPLRSAAAAAEHAELAAATLQRCAVTGWVRRLATTTGVAASPAQQRDPAVESLSPAERRVADAVAGGLTNRETAASLIVSVKTVDFHLQQIYRKLGIRSRTELAIRIMNSSPTDISSTTDNTTVDVRSSGSRTDR